MRNWKDAGLVYMVKERKTASAFVLATFQKDEKHLILVHEPEWEQLVDANKGEVLCENHKLDAVDILNALQINFTEVEKNS